MNDPKTRMRKTVRRLADQLAGIQTGSLSVKFLETFRARIDGTSTPLIRMGTIAHRGSQFFIRPFSADNTAAIVRVLVEAKLNAYALDPKTVCVTSPPMSVEQREQVAAHVKKLGEEAKVAIRSIRQDVRKQIAAHGRGSERAVQEDTDEAIAEIENLVQAKVATIVK
jgi:ribosome recycling factor